MFAYLLFFIIFLCVCIIIFEYLWLFLLAKNREKKRKFYDSSKKKITEMFQAAMHSSTQTSLTEEIFSLIKYVGENDVRMDIASEYIYNYLSYQNDAQETEKQICVRIYNELNPNKFYIKMLNNGNNYQKAFSCRKLSEFNAVEVINTIRSYIHTNNLDLKYHASMALSALGDHEGLVSIFTGELANNYFYSHRIMLEVLDVYSGDLLLLVKDILKNCNDYIKGTVIKAIAKYRFDELSDIYVENLTNKDINIKIACIRALGKLSDPKFEHELVIMTNDKEWSVRAAAVKSLEYYKSQISLEALTKATTDSNWWVRNNAAKTLVNVDDHLTYAKVIMNGYDRFAADAVKCAIYRKFKLE